MKTWRMCEARLIGCKLRATQMIEIVSTHPRLRIKNKRIMVCPSCGQVLGQSPYVKIETLVDTEDIALKKELTRELIAS